MSSAEYAAAASVGRHGFLDEESREWLRCLTVPAERERALARLHQLLLRAARAELRRRSLTAVAGGQEQDDLAHQAADDALLAITGKLDRFRGESRFTTWAYKFVMLEVSAKLGRHYWRHPPVPMSGDAWERIPDRFGADPAEYAESRELVAALRQAVTEVLSERQRRVFVALVVDGVPLGPQERGSREFVEPLLEQAGLPAALADALDDASWDGELRAETDEALALTANAGQSERADAATHPDEQPV